MYMVPNIASHKPTSRTYYGGGGGGGLERDQISDIRPT